MQQVFFYLTKNLETMSSTQAFKKGKIALNMLD